jgi:hypothetical protein
MLQWLTLSFQESLATHGITCGSQHNFIRARAFIGALRDCVCAHLERAWQCLLWLLSLSRAGAVGHGANVCW